MMQINLYCVGGTVLIIVLVLTYLLSKKQKKPRTAFSLGGKGGIMLPLIEKIKYNHDSYIFKFEFQEPDITLGIPVGQHVILAKKVPGIDTEVKRKYTPISHVNQKGSVDILIKIYRRNDHPKFPEGGKLTPVLEELQIGDKIKIMGPKGKFDYKGNGKVEYTLKKLNKSITKKFKAFCMVAGGTGIAPMFQVIKYIHEQINDPTELYLIFANKKEADILLRKELENYKNNGKLKLWYTLDEPPMNWPHFQGFLSIDMFSQIFPAPKNDILYCTCGPSPMNKLAFKLFEEFGVSEDNVFKF